MNVSPEARASSVALLPSLWEAVGYPIAPSQTVVTTGSLKRSFPGVFEVAFGLLRARPTRLCRELLGQLWVRQGGPRPGVREGLRHGRKGPGRALCSPDGPPRAVRPQPPCHGGALTDPGPAQRRPWTYIPRLAPPLSSVISQDLAFSQKIQSVSGRSPLAKTNLLWNIFQAHFRNVSG